MSRFDKLVPDYIRGLAPYKPGKPIRQAERESGIRCIKMASNENPLGPSPKALEAIRAAAAEVHLYPDMDAVELRTRLAERHHLQPDQVVLADGSTALLDLLGRVLLAPGRNAITSERSFIVYPIATRAAGGKLLTVPMKDDGFDLDAILAAINADTRLVFIANPNNPTGTLLPASAVDRFLECVPEHVLVVLDEAYCDFGAHFARARGLDYSHSLDYVRQGRNVVVLRTFSKAHGLAGLRLGYGFGPPELLQYLACVRTAFSVSAIAEAAGLAALEDEAHIRKTVENNAAQAPWLTQQLDQMGFRTIPTFANFIYFDAGEDGLALARRMQANGVIVRPLAAWGAPTALRVTVGTPEQNRAFLAALQKSTERVAAR
ncbi:MAG TPA: histidinol-phosphate transaminase [Terriglobales bacterium]|nr:histidinol-phosphate transaminase [Terriglobales bacterium]